MSEFSYNDTKLIRVKKNVPHCLIEYAKDVENQVEISKLVEAVFNGAYSSELFDSAQIKTRALAFEHYMVGNRKSDFIHVTLSILSGRTNEQKAQLSMLVLSQLKSLSLQATSLTVDVRDLDRASYAKAIV